MKLVKYERKRTWAGIQRMHSSSAYSAQEAGQKELHVRVAAARARPGASLRPLRSAGLRRTSG